MNYLIANGALVVLLTPANYILGHWSTFAAGGRQVSGTKLEKASSVSG